MKLEQSFTVKAPVDQVWAALIDVERVAPCLPGAEITGADEEGVYHGNFSVKIGPTSAAYRGTLKLEEVDEASHTATMSARGTDKRGQGGASATIVSTVVADDDGGTRVDTVTDFTITGKLARFGRGGMIQDVSKRLLRDFSTCLQDTLASTPGAPAAAAAPADEAPVPPPAAAVSPVAAAPAGALPAADAPPPAGTPSPAPPSAALQDSAAAAPAPPPVGTPAAARPARPPAKPINGLQLIASVLVERIKGLVAKLRGRRRRS